ncbi:hypothetical protein [Streptomyces sp. SID12501]|uniref:Uncharacterized protein n=1 Tax=Streptomyces sp. SID12501 TaxID=2706042 RepID=A0A6B3BZH9_9ACTN|nr:hypothetical protein [Streptomyces sp. SID12501]NEC89662.1 hypothetical protein [Streptomyces sp. SID12501]
MSDGRADTAALKPEDPTLLAYRLWFEHARKCDHCKRMSKASDGCDDGRALWGTYRLACIGRPEPKKESS